MPEPAAETTARPPDKINAAQLAAAHGLAPVAVRPPLRAYVRELWDRRHFVTSFASAKLTAQYSQATLGQLWQVATPLLNAMVYFLVFGVILRAKNGQPIADYIPFLVTGVFVFTFTQSSAMTGARAIAGNLGIVRALHFPRAALPISLAIQQLQQLLFSMGVLGVILICCGHFPQMSWLLIVPALFLQFIFNTGLCLVMARIGSKVPDLAQLLPFVLRTWMYVSGVMYDLSLMLRNGHAAHWVVTLAGLNPASVYIDLMRYALIDTFQHWELPAHVWAVALGWAIVMGGGGFIYFWKAEASYGRG